MGRSGLFVYTIELTRGSSWEQPAETLACRECQTDSIDFAVGEARHWLVQMQQEQPQRGASHYRVVAPSGAIVMGGPP
jgi:hypothetical protein